MPQIPVSQLKAYFPWTEGKYTYRHSGMYMKTVTGIATNPFSGKLVILNHM